MRILTIKLTIYFCILLSVHFLVGYPIVIRPYLKVKEKLASSQRELGEARKLVRAIPNPQGRVNALRQRMRELKKKAVSHREIPKIIYQLVKKSSELKVEIVSIKPKDKVDFPRETLPEGVSKAYIEIIMRCPYKVLGEYLKSLDELPIKFTVEKIVVEKIDEDKTLREKKEVLTTLLLSTYTILKL